MTASHKLFLLDVEGTVAPISLVTEQLFPYARAHFAEFLETNSGNASVEADLRLLAEENRAETEAGVPRMLGVPGLVRRGGETWESTNSYRTSALAYLLWLMDRDRKSTALKGLQGKIWKAGFESGELKGTLFDDVPAAFARWSAQGKVAIYSSGSVEAQQLLFRHSNHGDLTPMISGYPTASGYFDTRTGPKAASASYSAIAQAMQVEPGDAIFFSDVVRELDAAREAGFETRLVVREGNAPIDDVRGHAALESLSAI